AALAFRASSTTFDHFRWSTGTSTGTSREHAADRPGHRPRRGSSPSTLHADCRGPSDNRGPNFYPTVDTTRNPRPLECHAEAGVYGRCATVRNRARNQALASAQAARRARSRTVRPAQNPHTHLSPFARRRRLTCTRAASAYESGKPAPQSP